MCDFHKHAITTYKVITCNRVISDCIYNIIQWSLCFCSDIKAHHHKCVSTAILDFISNICWSESRSYSFVFLMFLVVAD